MEKAVLVKVAETLGLETSGLTVAQLNDVISNTNMWVVEDPTIVLARLEFDNKERKRNHALQLAEAEKETAFQKFKLEAAEMALDRELHQRHETERLKHERDMEAEKLKWQAEKCDKDRSVELELQLARLKNSLDVAAVGGESSKLAAAPIRPIRLERLRDQDDPLVFFAAMEKIFAARSIPDSQQVGHLVELLGPKALDSFSRMSLEDSKSYQLIRSTILKRFRVSSETVRERFRSATVGDDEAYSEFAVRLTGCATTWL